MLIAEEIKMEFITKEEWAKIRAEDSTTLLNEVLTRFFNKSVETSLRSMPELISRLVKKSVVMERLTKEFFDKNPTFSNQREIVNKTITEIELKNPGATYEEILRLSTGEINKKIAVTSSVKSSNLYDFKE